MAGKYRLTDNRRISPSLPRIMLVSKKFLALPDFITDNGFSLPAPTAAYEEYGLADGPVILLCHGGLSSCHAAGRYHPDDPRPGWWDALIGADRVFDTNCYRIVALNALGSMYGSCGPTSPNPASGRHYGPDFPRITLHDQVRFIAAFLDALEIPEVAIMAGPSMGSLHTLAFAAEYPARVGRAIAVATAARMTPSGMAMHHFMSQCLAADPEFKDGWYDGQLQAFRTIWQVIKLYYTSHRIFDRYCEEEGATQSERSDKARDFILAGMDAGIRDYDPNAFIRVLDAINSHDLGAGHPTLTDGIRRIVCPLLLINIDTDQEFPPARAAEIAAALNTARPDQATVRTIVSDWGHLACTHEPGQLASFIADWLTPRS